MSGIQGFCKVSPFKSAKCLEMACFSLLALDATRAAHTSQEERGWRTSLDSPATHEVSDTMVMKGP